jgi:hypothetical protein
MEDADFIRISRQMDMPLVYRGPQEFAKHLTEMNEEVGSLINKLGLLADPIRKELSYFKPVRELVVRAIRDP